MEFPASAGVFAAGLVVTLAVAPVTAQREPCRGTLQDPAGAAIAGATVTFVQEVSQALGGTPDRIEVRTDERGAFSGDLLRGSPYVVWAIGPRQANGEHLVTGASMQAAAGKQIALWAGGRAAPRTIAVRGAAPWVVDAPPALRVLVAGQYACGRDVVLAGDGQVRLGPWPDEPVEVALVDGDGQLLDLAAVHDGVPASVSFSPPKEFACQVTDTDGAPIAGAAIWAPAPSLSYLRGCDPLPNTFVARWRRAGVTDATGQATILLPWSEKWDERSFLLLASGAGYAAEMDGMMGGKRLLGPRGQRRDEDLFQFALTKRDATSMRLGEDARGVAAIAFGKSQFFRFANGGGATDVFVPAALEGQEARPTRFDLPIGSGAVHAYLRAAATADVAPTRLVAGFLGASAPEALEVAGLRAHRLEFVDAEERPAPFVQVVVGVPGAGYPRRWYDRCVADAAGVVTLRDASADWLVLATDGAHVWCHTIDAGDAGGTLRLRGEAMPLLSLRCVDAAGAGLANVGVAVDCWPRLQANVPPKDWRANGLALLADPLLRAARSDHTGTLRAPLLAGPMQDVVFRRGALGSRPLRLAQDAEVGPVELK